MHPIHWESIAIVALCWVLRGRGQKTVLPLPHLCDSSAHCWRGRRGDSKSGGGENKIDGKKFGLIHFAFYLYKLFLLISNVCMIGMFLIVFLGVPKRIDNTGEARAHFSLSFLWHDVQRPRWYSLIAKYNLSHLTESTMLGCDRLIRIFCLHPGLVVGLWKVSPACTCHVCSVVHGVKG